MLLTCNFQIFLFLGRLTTKEISSGDFRFLTRIGTSSVHLFDLEVSGVRKDLNLKESAQVV